jgi:hypothetical protein
MAGLEILTFDHALKDLGGVAELSVHLLEVTHCCVQFLDYILQVARALNCVIAARLQGVRADAHIVAAFSDLVV